MWRTESGRQTIGHGERVNGVNIDVDEYLRGGLIISHEFFFFSYNYQPIDASIVP
jgi:hypothetical protein